ncbi:MAG: hypothetical protein HYZ54_02030 [Ignavibacteriae bacterium]|nr:hypothetical protein [Ignavibacteriota bacterium]
MPQIDINELANNPKLNLSITSSQDEPPQDASIRRFKEVVLFFVTLAIILCVFSFCGYMLLSSHFSVDDKKWATAVESSIVSALLGYLGGKKES